MRYEVWLLMGFLGFTAIVFAVVAMSRRPMSEEEKRAERERLGKNLPKPKTYQRMKK